MFKYKIKSRNRFASFVLSAILYLVFPVFLAGQQPVTVTGKVTDQTGVSIPGANIIVKGQTIGTISDADGNFTLQAPSSDVSLVASFIGFNSKEEPINGRTVINFVLTEDDHLLRDVVVVGYGTMRKGQISGSIASVNADELPKAATASVGAMLRGRAAGLNITQNSAKPGGNLDIKIRGSITGASPLVVIDGVPQTSFANQGTGTVYSGGNRDRQMISLNPNDVESIDILKDASAAAIYGSDAAGGVILITTKRGKEGITEVTYNGSMSFQTLSDFPKFLNAKDFMIEQNKVFDELGRPGEKKHSLEKINNFVGDGTIWIDEVTRTGVVREHNISVRSGNDKSKHLISLGYFDHEGVAKNNALNRFTGRINVDQKFNSFLKGGLYTSFSQIKYNDVPLGNTRHENSALIFSAMTFNPTVPVYDEFDNYSENPDRPIYPNPVSLLDITDDTANKNLNVTGFLEADIFKGFSLKLSAGADIRDSKANQYIPTTTKVGFEKGGIASKRNAEDQMNIVNLIANYRTVINNHSMDFMAGGEYKKQSWIGMSMVASQFPYDGALYNNIQSSEQEKPDISSYKGSREMASFISRINYSYRDKYSATFNLRVDGSSNFAPDHQYGAFPGLSAAWRISEEPWVQNNLPAISNLKIRAGVGQTGNAGNLTGIYTYYRINPNAYAFNNSMVNGIGMAKIGNPNLKWETLTDYSLGIDFGLLRNKISGAIDIYKRFADDIIMQKDLMSYHEIKVIDYNSVARYQTRGIDINLNTVNFYRPNFTWETNINFTYYENHTVKRDADFNPEINITYKEKWNNVWRYQSDGLIQSGETVAHQPNAQAGNIKYKDLNGYKLDEFGVRMRDEKGNYIYSGEPDGVLNAADLVLVGNSTPIPVGINNTFTYKNFDLNVYFYGSLNGFKSNELKELTVAGITDMTYGLNALDAVKNRWSPSNPDGTLPSVFEAVSGTLTDRGDFFMEDAWFLRLDNVTLGYTLPKNLTRNLAQSVRCYAGARNLFVITPFEGMDPETGIGIGAYPNQRTYTFGIDIRF